MGLMARAGSRVVRGFPEVWLDAEGEIGIRAVGTQLIPGEAGEPLRALPLPPPRPARLGMGRGMQNTGDPPCTWGGRILLCLVC